METRSSKNLENFTVIRGGQYATSPATVKVKRKVQERIVALLRAGVPVKDRALENVAAGVTNPMGEPVKLMRRLRKARRSFVQTWHIVIEPQVQALHDEYGKEYHTGEFEPAA